MAEVSGYDRSTNYSKLNYNLTLKFHKRIFQADALFAKLNFVYIRR